MSELDGPRWGPRSGAAQQLVVICHGVGADGQDLIDLAPQWSTALPHAAFAAPDAPFPYDMAPPGLSFGRQWFSLKDRTPAKLIAGAEIAAPILERFIDAELDRLSLPADAVALMGFSQGAMMVLQVGLRRIPAPRAVMAYSGALLLDAARIDAATAPPVLLVHGEADEVVPVERTRIAERVLREAGAAVESLYAPRLGHSIDDAGLTAGALFLQRAFAT